MVLWINTKVKKLNNFILVPLDTNSLNSIIVVYFSCRLLVKTPTDPINSAFLTNIDILMVLANNAHLVLITTTFRIGNACPVLRLNLGLVSVNKILAKCCFYANTCQVTCLKHQLSTLKTISLVILFLLCLITKQAIKLMISQLRIMTLLVSKRALRRVKLGYRYMWLLSLWSHQ